MCFYKKRSPPSCVLKSTTKIFLPQLVRPLFCGHTGCTSGLDRQAKSTHTVESSSIYVLLNVFVRSIFPKKIVHNLDISVLQALRVYLGHSPPHSKRHATRARLWILLVLPDRLLGQPLVLLFPQRSSSHCRLPLTILALMEIGVWNLISNFVVSTCFLLRADIVSDLCRFLIVALLTTGKRGWNSW